jgi:pimeloyl-ACP methyl ester carboxylesterase
LIAVTRPDEELYVRHSVATTAFLRVQGGLADLAAGQGRAALELHSAYADPTVMVGDRRVPLELDVTTAHAHMLNQPIAWTAGRTQFFGAATAVRSQIIMSEPYQPGRVPLVLVHGTFSSPVWWAEMVNSLNADPVLREHVQIWTFIYSSSKPIELSANELRRELTATLQEIDPAGADPSLREMVVIGHSQGGLLTRLTVTATGDKLWRVFSEQAPEELAISEAQRQLIRDTLYYEPLPFVKRVVFLATPHRGSYRAGRFARSLARKFVTLPLIIERTSAELIRPAEGVELPDIYRAGAPTSLDEMSPDNPVLQALADLPVAPGVRAHSIIPVLGDGDPGEGRDGVVAYSSAHLDGIDSELVVRGSHSCQALPATIEEVRRILHEHLAGLKPR